MTREASELELQGAILEAAAVYGWLRVHFRPARTARGWRTPITGDPGFPDVVLAKESRGFNRALALELKGPRGRLEPGQADWLEALDGALVDARLVMPADLDEILELLR